MLWLGTVVLVLLPQSGGVVHGRPNNLKIPKPRKVQQPQDPVAPKDLLQERFHEAVLELRRSRYLSSSQELALVRRLSEQFDLVPERALKLARTADQDLMHGVLRVLQTYGRAEHARDLKFLLLTRGFGTSTQLAVKTLVQLAQGDAREMLFECLTASKDAVRRYASEVLDEYVGPDDVEHLLTLSMQARTDVQLKVLRLLGRVDDERARKRLVDALAQRPSHAEAACRGLVTQGELAAPALQEILRKPSRGRQFAYAAYALARVEEQTGREFVDETMHEHLVRELDMPDPFTRTAVSMALSSLAWRSDDTSGTAYLDEEVVENLLSVVAPTEFVAHLSMLQDLALARLTRFTGRTFGLQHRTWREWWGKVGNTETPWVGARRRVAVDAASAGTIELIWAGGGAFSFRFVGEDNVERIGKPIPNYNVPILDYVLGKDEAFELVQELERAGFMRAARTVRLAQPDERVLALRVGGAACRTDPQLSPRVLDRFGKIVNRWRNARAWQLYRDPYSEPDAAAFWRAETRWLAANPTPEAHQDRLKSRVLTRLDELVGPRLVLALQHLAEIPNLAGRLSEADGEKLVKSVAERPEWDETSYKVLELALLAPGDEPWQQALAAAETKQGDEGRLALQRIFALLGPDRMRRAAQGGSKRTRLAAMDELAKIKDLKSVPLLLAALEDDDVAVQETAVYSLGVLQATRARQPLIELLAQGGDALTSRVKRSVWVALARIGGSEVFPVLQAAFYSQDPADRVAVVKALGSLDHPSAADQLAEIFALRGDDELGLLSLEYLRRKGDLAASPALRQHLENPNQDVRRLVAMTLGEFQDPAAVPELIRMLAEDADALRVTALLAGTTGVDVTGRNDRVEFFRRWWALNATSPQGAWLLRSLEDEGQKSVLTGDQLLPTSGTSAIPELTRLMIECPVPHLRSLSARMLRVTTGEDFGTLSALAPEDRRLALAERYRFLLDQGRAAGK